MKTPYLSKRSVLCTVLCALLIQGFASVSANASTIPLNPSHMGYYWYEKNSWMGGSYTDTGFSYGDAGGMQHVQTNYQYYGGADRYWQQKDLYFQIDLSSITNDVEQALFCFYVASYDSPSPAMLKHVSTQTVAATGDAGQKLVGTTDVAGTDSFVLGWNSLDLTAYIQSDLDKGYSFSAFSIAKFAQAQDENRTLSLYGPASTTLVQGQSTQPHLITVIPEPAILSLALAGLAVLRRRRTV